MVEHEVATLGTAVRFRLLTDFVVLLVSMSGCEPEGTSSILVEVRTYGVTAAQQALILVGRGSTPLMFIPLSSVGRAPDS